MFARKSGVTLYQDYEEWGVLFDSQSGESLVVNPVGIVIWQALTEPCVVETLVSAVREAFEDVPEGLVGDVGEFVGGLVEKRFVVIISGKYF